MTISAVRRTVLVPILVLTAACSGGLAPASAPPPSSSAVTTVYVVRHAERASATDSDSPLSDEGRRRARDLAVVLADAGIDAVYTSQYVRTRDTAAPLADRLGLPVTVHPVADAEGSSRELAGRILTDHRGETVLVVGHSNTISLIVRALGGADPGEIEDSEYDNLFIVTVRAPGEAETTLARFGESR